MIYYVICFTVRILSYFLISYETILKDLPFLNTRFSDFDTILEGIYLIDQKINPYEL